MIYDVVLVPNSKHARIVPLDEKTLKVYVTQPPHENKANAALVEALRRHFKVPKSVIRIVCGAASRNKRVEIAA